MNMNDNYRIFAIFDHLMLAFYRTSMTRASLFVCEFWFFVAISKEISKNGHVELKTGNERIRNMSIHSSEMEFVLDDDDDDENFESPFM